MFQCPHGLELLRAAASAEGGYLQVFQCPHGLELLLQYLCDYYGADVVSMPSRAWIVTSRRNSVSAEFNWFQCPHGLELLRLKVCKNDSVFVVSMPSRAWIVTLFRPSECGKGNVSMPSWAWIVTNTRHGIWCRIAWFQCPHGLELLLVVKFDLTMVKNVSMPSRAWIVTFQHFSGRLTSLCFNALTGLNCYWLQLIFLSPGSSFNALTGLNCYGKNVQYFKFFMILFMHTCYL